MTSLEDILKSFGVTEKFWSADIERDQATAARPPGEDEAWDQLKALAVGLTGEEERTFTNKVFDGVQSGKPVFTVLAEIYQARGDSAAAARARDRVAEAASRAREALLRDHADPRDLCCLGRALLERCEANDLPLCEDNFLGSTFDFGSGDQLRIDYFHFVDPAVESYPDEPKTASLAIQAFGIAWIYYRERSAKRSDAWRALQALDGLRAAFLHINRVEALQAVSETFWDWLEDWSLNSGSSDEFVSNFRSADAYVLGRFHRDPANRRVAGQTLANKLTDTWEHLPQLSREYLINAEILFEHLDKKGDWSSAVNDYSKAIEVLLRERLGRQLDEGHPTNFARVLRSAIDTARRSPTRRYSRVSLSTFSQALAVVGPRLKQQRLNQVANDLDKLVQVRSRAAHAVGVGEGKPWKISRQECEQIRSMCLGLSHDGLVRILANHDLNK